VAVRWFYCTLLIAALVGLAGCGTLPSGGASAFDDCHNRPPLYQQEHGCYERQ
jgi:hypothetical protein